MRPSRRRDACLRIAVLAFATAGTSPAVAAPLLIMVFQTATTGPVVNPCTTGHARSVQILDLKREISQDPGLQPMLTECLVSNHTAAKATSTDMTVAVYRTLGPRHTAIKPIVPQGAGHFELVVLSSPTAGNETEYNRWYDHEHIDGVLGNPGFLAGQRYEIVSSDSPAGYPVPRYAATYRFRSIDWQASMTEIRRRLSTGEVRSSPTFDVKTGVNRYYELRQ